MRNSVILNTLPSFALGIGLALTIFGLTQQHWPNVLPWVNEDAFLRYAISLGLVVSTVAVAGKLFHRDPHFIGAILLVLISVASGAVWPLMVTLWFVLASVVMGQQVLAVLRTGNDSDAFTTPFLIGAGIYGTGIGLFAHLPVNYPGVYGLALLLPLISGRQQVIDTTSNLFAWIKMRCGNHIGIDWLGVAIVGVGMMHFAMALMPEVMYDALALHLFVPTQLALRHVWGFDPSLYSLALIPMLGDWLFSIGYMLAGETGARLINLTFTYFLAWQGYQLVLWLGGKENGGKWASLLFLATPLTLTETSSLYIEAIWASFVVAGTSTVFHLVTNTEKDRKAVLINAGLMFGFAAATKAVTLSILPALAGMLLFRWRRWIKRDVLSVTINSLALFILVGFIPYFSAWLISGNPVFPFFNGIFNSPYFVQTNFDNPLFKSGLTWNLPYRVAFDSNKYLEATNGAAGFQWLLLLPAAIVALALKGNRRALSLFTFSLVSIAFIFHSQSYLRYVFPMSLLMCAVIGTTMSPIKTRERYTTWAMPIVAAFTLCLNLLFITSATWTYRDFPLKILVDASERDNYLLERLPIRKAISFVNLLNTERTPVSLLCLPFAAGLNTDALHTNWYNQRFQDAILKARDDHEIARVLRYNKSNFVLLDSTWSTDQQRKNVELATLEVARFGNVSVRRLRDEYKYGLEALQNPDFSSMQGWAVSSDSIFNESSGSVIVTVTAPVTQVIRVEGGSSYLNTVTARCVQSPASGRVQVNWLDAKSRFIKADIQVFDCTEDWQDHQQSITAPENAQVAVVYGSAHTGTPIELTKVSFR